MMRAALLGPYAPRFACGLLPDIDATATIAPRAALSAGWADLARSQAARALTANTRSQSSTEYCRSAPGRLIPALLTSPSRPPKRPTASATTCAGASALPMSACRARASASSFPRSSIRLSSSRNGTKSTAAIFAAWPRARASRARRRHVARPIPLAAPVTRTRMQPPLGRSVTRLEDALKHPLATRSRRRSRPQPRGRQLGVSLGCRFPEFGNFPRQFQGSTQSPYTSTTGEGLPDLTPTTLDGVLSGL